MITPVSGAPFKRPQLADEVVQELLALPERDLIEMLIAHWRVPLSEVYGEWKITERGGFFGDFRTAQGRRLSLPREAGLVSAQLQGTPIVPLEPGNYYGMALQLANHRKREQLKKPFALETTATQLVIVSTQLQQVLQAAKTMALAGQVPNSLTLDAALLPVIKQRQLQVVSAQEWAERRAEIAAALAVRTNLGDWGNRLASGLLGQVSARLATASDRMFWELLQNADDKPTKSQRPATATFQLLPNYLLFLHNGQPFSRADVEGIADATNGTKPEEENMTGYKGIGFKSVFATSRAVYVLSGGYSFRFKPEPDEDATKVPWMVWPRWTELAQYPEELLKHDAFFQSIASSVAIGLEMGSEQIERYTELLPHTFAQPTFLLFLRAVRVVRIEGLPTPMLLRRVDQPKYEVELWNNQQRTTYWRQDFSIEVPAEEHEAAQLDKQMPASLQRAQHVKLTLAVPLTESGPQAVAATDSIIYCFLPTTDSSFALPALVNGDFLTDPSREKVLPEKAWNNFLFRELGSIWPRWLASLLTHKPQWASAVYKLLPLCYADKLDDNKKAFNAGLTEAIAKTSFILTADQQLVRPTEAILDHAGLAAVLPELYAAHLTEGLQLVHPAAARVLTGGQDKLLGLKKITQPVVLTLLGKSTVTTYTPQRAVDLLQHAYQNQDAALLSALKSTPWLFDQHDKALAPNISGRFGIVDEDPDADLPFGKQLRYLHSDLQMALKADLALRTWFEGEFPLLPTLTRAAALVYLGGRLGAGQVTSVEAMAVARYLFELYGKKELGLVGESKTLGKLPVLSKDGAWRAVTQLYVADYYQPSYPFETLAAELGGQFAFVAESYCAASEAAVWGTFWGQLGAKRPAKVELLTDSLLPMLKANKLSEVGHDNLLKFALKLYSETKPGALDAEWPKLGALRLRTIGQGRQALADCLINDAYPAGTEVAGRLLPQGLPMQLAAVYATVPKVEPAVVRQFLAAATGKAPVTADSTTVKALAHLTGVGAPATLTESVRVVRELVTLAAEGKLASSFKSVLSNLPLYLKNRQTQVAGRCYLGTEYEPKLDIEQLTGGTEKAVLDAAYLIGADDEIGVRKLLTEWLGVREQFEPEWHSQVSGTKLSLQPIMQPYWEYVNSRNTGLGNQTVEFTNLLVVNNLELVKSEPIAKHLAATLASKWPSKPDTFPKCTYRIAGKTLFEMSPWAGPPKFHLRGPAGKLPQSGERYLSNCLNGVASKNAWVAMHSWGSLELERYLGLQTELSLAEQLEAFAEQSDRLQSVPLTKGSNPEFEKLAASLLAHFKEELKGQDLSSWRAKLHWPAADGSWRPLMELHWLAADVVKQYYAEGRPQLMWRTKGLIPELRNFCLALKVSIIQAADFRPVPPPDGGRSHTVALQQRASDNHLLRLLVYRRFGYDEPEVLARLKQELVGLQFIEVPTVQLECVRIPGFIVPVEDRCRVDDTQGIFYFSGALFTGWRHLPALGKFLEQRLSGNAPAQIIVDVLRARDAVEVRECLREAGWAVPDWLAAPRASSLPPPLTQAQTSLKPAAPATTSLPAPEPIDYGQEDTADVRQGDGGAHALYSPGVSAEIRKDYQKEAREAAVPWLREHGYTVDDKAHDGYSTFGPVIRSTEGPQWRVVVKSYRGGILYLNPNEWLTLAGESSFLLLYKPRPGQAASAGMELITSLDEVHRRNPNVIVRLENTDPKGSIVSLTQLADAHQFSGSFKFIFDSPSNKEFDFELTGNHTATGPLPVDDQNIVRWSS